MAQEKFAADFSGVLQLDVTVPSPGKYEVKFPFDDLPVHYAAYVTVDAVLQSTSAGRTHEQQGAPNNLTATVTPVNGDTSEVEAQVTLTVSASEAMHKTVLASDGSTTYAQLFRKHREQMMNAVNTALGLLLRPEFLLPATGQRSSTADLIQMKLFLDLGEAINGTALPTASVILSGTTPIPPATMNVTEPAGFGHSFDPIAALSGPAEPADYKPPTTVSLQRTTRPLTGDVALWLLIKLNADTLSFDNYVRQMDLLFFPDGPNATQPDPAGSQQSPLYPNAAKLSRRRFLPFTDTDAYRGLKVATEAFVVTWGGVAPRGADTKVLQSLLALDPAAVALANERLGLNITAPNVLSNQYFGSGGSPTLPYLQRVATALQGTDAAVVIEDALEQETAAIQFKKATASANGMCGESCLWLSHWNDNISAKLTHAPLIELIWSYWMEEMQLVQTMNAVTRRFQNVSSGPRDPLAQLELDPLRPLNNLIWGWVQDEQHRLPIERRALEYSHHYGFRIFGKAVPTARPADNRSKFLEAFHTLLNLCVPFFRQADDTTVVPDGFPLLNALREVHLILSEGAHNQFRDLPTTARVEMMMQQWLLARPEFREFLPRRAMVAYPEPWMHSVESMRKLQGWGDTNTYQFWQLATTGEQIVSSIRWGDWNSINDPVNAANWATFFRPEIQTYIHSYRAVTGIDVSAEPVDVQVPGIHLLRRLQEHKGARAA
ncbi:hypothetical protein GCM10010970_19940 [Silvimonas iriomotensis]|uniref:Uncharacterized protein n=2 Tax=Silvimonas iriomotensis TaxID=449662 RepID=A0ABQ2P911_9NEIS|nr:hypothetical protein GCM10010970_19940 [Silvimonas iriomotensis]